MQKLRRLAVMAEASLLLGVSRLLVLFVPFGRWRKSLGVISARPEQSATRSMADTATQIRARAIGRQVTRAAHKVPFRAVCLPQAMAARWMLARRGIETQLYIGARRSEKGRAFDFHAWLMLGEDCLTGQEERDAFNAFGSDEEAAA